MERKVTCQHNTSKLGYIAWHNWAEKKVKQGHRQYLCPTCKLYFFKCEFMKLNELKVGDKFYPQSMAMKATPLFEVVDKHTGMSGKVVCKNLQTGERVKKIGKQEVIKTK